MTNNNYNENHSPVNPITFQKRVNVHHDMNAILFDDDNPDHIVQASQQGVSAAVDILADAENTLFISCTNAFTFRVQFTDDSAPTENDWFNYCDGDGNLMSFTCTADKKAIPMPIKARQMRVIATNGGATDEAPYVGLM